MRQDTRVVKWIIIGVVFIVIVVAVGLLLRFKNSIVIRIDDKVLSVRVADTDHERIKGLSNTKPLADNEGMLFVYNTANDASIWMKDMQYSLDIMWLDENKRIIEIVENVTPESYPKIFQPHQPAWYVIEVPAGYVEKNKITRGSVVTFNLPQ